MDKVISVLGYVLLPVIATIIGGVAATFRVPGPRLSSSVQHFAAGIVFAAVAGELLPEITGDHAPVAVIIGFSLGVAVMLLIKMLTGNEAPTGKGEDIQPNSLVAVVGIDVFIDGLLIGVGFAAGAKVGILLSIALTLELLFLGLSTAASLGKAGTARGRTIAIVVGLAAVPLVGAIIGITLLSGLTGFALAAVLAFRAAALLYLVTEELLVEAHEAPETPLLTSMFFLGFLVLFIIETNV